MVTAKTGNEALRESVAIMARLRGPDGCPWDRVQTFETIKRHTLEETYEVFDAIDRRDWVGLKDELGDLLLQVLFYAQMADDEGLFSIEDVAANLNAKLIRRHPHIFADAKADTPDKVKQTWDEIKKKEKEERGEQSRFFLDDVSRHQPALLEAAKLGKRASTVGFDWPDAQGLIAKLREEATELEAELVQSPPDPPALEAELGDVMFTTVNLARHLGIEPEFTLRAANEKFRRRFNAMEDAAGGAANLRIMTPSELEARWRAAKQATAGQEPAKRD